ncbi:37S ribosomal protein MRP1, mitochondrial [Wickerhamomyces ciferrii]|uniref:37S ribosomal protein MRP1, mitochondrial n=1 Tax=Wickerhamomyces ciferrii (strain ATCC 14091 / BCRC 22168 / CBS 111 / JCM 3599 / NBRC 0793 / NRRL Y-1031 F-60-10) TaxID=1206466 RepID=K0KQS0_WICCF|nr:37S ribosomal protein MRP1, mitochondrial [Wickerhamomyces ciferrii]CCH45431.1 37S ribosomal protein MRP1, mitochondrial [Wickerhamomyces ciferrii]
MMSLRTRLLAGARRYQSTGPVVQVYKTPSISYIDENQKIPGLLSEKGLENAWYKRAELYCEGLNHEIARSGLAPHDIDVLVKEYAKSPSKLNLFNNASLLSNLEFAFRSIGEVRSSKTIDFNRKLDESSILQTPNLSQKIENLPTDDEFVKWINSSFGSMLEFKTLLLNSASAINGDGFTWVVAKKTKSNDQKDEYDDLFIMNTYNAGTPNNSIKFGQITELTKKLQELKNEHDIHTTTSSILSLQEARESSGYGDFELKPILALDVSPKVWLYDYGVFGKNQYLEQVWNAIDWDIVQRRLPTRSSRISDALNY